MINKSIKDISKSINFPKADRPGLAKIDKIPGVGSYELPCIFDDKSSIGKYNNNNYSNSNNINNKEKVDKRKRIE